MIRSPIPDRKAPSARKLAAARANGALARGRKSLQGIARSSQNSLKHGLTAETIVLSSEEAAQFSELRASYIAALQPRNQVESDLLDEVIAAQWRKRRAVAIESAVFDLRLSDQREQVDKEFKVISPDVRTALAFQGDSRDQGGLLLLSRYEARFSRTYLRSLRLLADMLSRPPAPPAAPLPQPPAPAATDGAVGSNIAVQNDANPISGHNLRIQRFVKRSPEEKRADGEPIFVTPRNFA